MEPKFFSIRNPLQGELHDFVMLSGFNCTHTTDLVRDLTCLLANYREEDMPLFPEVFILPSVEAIMSLSPGTQRVPMGTVHLSNDADKILKDCANLALHGWAIYISKINDNQAEYGVFRSLLHSFARSAEEAMADYPEKSPSIIIRNRGRLIVELRNAKGETFTAIFTSAVASGSNLATEVKKFVSATVSLLSQERRERFEPYLVRILLDILQHSHGTLLAAHVPLENGQLPDTLKDGVWLNKSIDIADVYHTALDTNDAQSLASLQAIETLLTGMIASDGIVVFGTDGTLLGYRVFLKPTEEESRNLPHKGGGRRRSYALLEQRLEANLRAALFRSQDGDIECRVTE